MLGFVWLEFANKELHAFLKQANGGRNRNNQFPFFKSERGNAHELAEK
jgi:hypothetical protein